MPFPKSIKIVKSLRIFVNLNKLSRNRFNIIIDIRFGDIYFVVKSTQIHQFSKNFWRDEMCPSAFDNQFKRMIRCSENFSHVFPSISQNFLYEKLFALLLACRIKSGTNHYVVKPSQISIKHHKVSLKLFSTIFSLFPTKLLERHSKLLRKALYCKVNKKVRQ